MNTSCLNLGIVKGQKWKNWSARFSDERDLRISEASEVVRVRFRVLKYSERSRKGSEVG